MNLAISSKTRVKTLVKLCDVVYNKSVEKNKNKFESEKQEMSKDNKWILKGFNSAATARDAIASAKPTDLSLATTVEHHSANDVCWVYAPESFTVGTLRIKKGQAIYLVRSSFDASRYYVVTLDGRTSSNDVKIINRLNKKVNEFIATRLAAKAAATMAA
jgi:hypothetical protein